KVENSASGIIQASLKESEIMRLSFSAASRHIAMLPWRPRLRSRRSCPRRHLQAGNSAPRRGIRAQWLSPRRPVPVRGSYTAPVDKFLLLGGEGAANI